MKLEDWILNWRLLSEMYTRREFKNSFDILSMVDLEGHLVSIFSESTFREDVLKNSFNSHWLERIVLNKVSMYLIQDLILKIPKVTAPMSASNPWALTYFSSKIDFVKDRYL